MCVFIGLFDFREERGKNKFPNIKNKTKMGGRKLQSLIFPHISYHPIKEYIGM